MPLRTHPLPLISFLCSPHLPHPHQPIYTSISTFSLTCSDPQLPPPLSFIIFPRHTFPHQTTPLHTCLPFRLPRTPFFTSATTPTSHGFHYTSFTPSLTLPTHLLSPLLLTPTRLFLTSPIPDSPPLTLLLPLL